MCQFDLLCYRVDKEPHHIGHRKYYLWLCCVTVQIPRPLYGIRLSKLSPSPGRDICISANKLF